MIVKFTLIVWLRSLETECRRSTELQEMLSAAERRGGELPSSGDDQSITELKSQLDEQLRRASELQALLDDESQKLSADKVHRSRHWCSLSVDKDV